MPNAADPGTHSGVHHHTDTNAHTNGAGSCHFTRAGGQGGSDRWHDLADYLTAVVGPLPGWVHVATGWVPQREASGRIGFRLWQQGCAA